MEVMNANTPRQSEQKVCRRKWTTEQKLQILQDLVRSGLSMWDYSQKHRIGYSSLTAWKRKFSSISKNGANGSSDHSLFFRELPNVQASPSETDIAPMRIRFPNGTILEVVSGFDPDLVKVVLTQLR